MKRTIELSEDEEQALLRWQEATGRSGSELLQAMLSVMGGSSAPSSLRRALFESLESGELPIRSTPGVMGGDTCIRNTRIPIWTLVDCKRQGLTDSQILQAFPGLIAADLSVAWEYYAARGDEINAQWKRHQEDVEHE